MGYILIASIVIIAKNLGIIYYGETLNILLSQIVRGIFFRASFKKND